jgi:signal transduction histidine kinase
MRLADFIEQHMPVILASWDAFAASLLPAAAGQAALPNCRIELAVDGATHGCWDASRMKQVLSNLVTNAARYGDPGGPVMVSLNGTEAELRLSVENPGPPIPKESIELLFEPLRRGAGSDVSPERTSMGLGLFIVRQVAQAHGGTVVVDSSDGRTIFTVVLPRMPHWAT